MKFRKYPLIATILFFSAAYLQPEVTAEGMLIGSLPVRILDNDSGDLFRFNPCVWFETDESKFQIQSWVTTTSPEAHEGKTYTLAKSDGVSEVGETIQFAVSRDFLARDDALLQKIHDFAEANISSNVDQ